MYALLALQSLPERIRELGESQGGQAVRSSTETLIAAMHILETEIQSEDGAANAAVAEAGERLAEQHMRIAQLEQENDALRADLLLWNEKEVKL